MKNFTLMTALSFLMPALAFANPYSTDDYSQKQIQAFKSLTGVYASADGAKMTTVFENIQDSQGDLFGPRKFAFYISSDLKTHYDVYFDLSNLEKNSAENVTTFETIQDDCDDPGCTTYEAKLVFTQNPDGKMQADLEAHFIVHAEDIMDYVAEGVTEENVTESDLEQACAKAYGPAASLYDYNGATYCEYSVNKTFTRK